MTVRIVLGAPASGKTEWLIRRIRDLKARQTFSESWVLVPDGSKVAYLQKRIGQAGGAVGVHVGSFGTLCRNLLEQNGNFMSVMPPAMNSQIVQDLLAQAWEDGELEQFANIKEKPGLIEVLQDAFAELRGGALLPDDILAHPEASLIEKEIARLYRRYLSQLEHSQWSDEEGLSWKARQALLDSPRLAGSISLVAVDGFTDLTRSRRQFLRALAQQVGELIITLPGEREGGRPVNAHTLNQLKILQQEFDAELIELERGNFTAPHLQMLQESVFEEREVVVPDLSEPLLLEVPGQAEEAREALRWLKRKHLREGIALEEMAVFVSDLEAYRPWLSLVGSEFGLPLYFLEREKLSNSPAIDAILRFLRLALDGFPSRDLLGVFSAPYLNFGFSSSQLMEVDRIAVKQIVVSGREQWQEAWQALLAQPSEDKAQSRDDEEDISESALTDLAEITGNFDRFWALFEGIEQAQSLSAWLTWLDERIRGLGFYKNLETQDDLDAGRTLSDLLQSLLMTEEVLGARNLTFEGFYSLLSTAIKAKSLEQSENRQRSAIFIAGIGNARANRYDCVAILGLNEGGFPVRENADPFLSEPLRAALGLEPRLGRQQQSIFHQAISRANRDLLLTRAYLNESGEQNEPSAYWKAVQLLIPENGVRKMTPGQLLPQSEAGSLSEMLTWAARQSAMQYAELPEAAERWRDLAEARTVLNARRAEAGYGEFEGEIAVEPEDVARPIWSASAFETFASCPFHFYAAYLLGLEARKLPELGFDSAQRGQIYHKVLEKVYREVIEHEVRPIEIVEEIALQVFSEAPRKLGFRPSLLWQIEQEQMLELLKKNIAKLEENRENWQPYRLEYSFGVGWEPPLIVSFEDGTELSFRGFIDRIDVNGDGNYRVIDYKTASSTPTKTDLKKGTRLQLPLYARAVEDALEGGKVVDGFYWSLGSQQAGTLSLAKLRVEAAWQMVKEHIRAGYQRILVGDFIPRAPENQCPDYCPAKGWCWRYQKGSF